MRARAMGGCAREWRGATWAGVRNLCYGDFTPVIPTTPHQQLFPAMCGHNCTDGTSANTDNQSMPNTGERGEIASRTNANEAETVQRSKKLLSKTKQLIATADAKNLARNTYRGGPAGTSPEDSGKTAQDHTHVAALKPFADSYEGGHHTAKRPELASRKDVRRAVRGMRASNDK
jgi:hypothetical protein